MLHIAHSVHTHKHTHANRHTKTTYSQETNKPLGSLPFTQKPLGKVVQSNTNTFSLVSEEVLRFEKRLSQSPKVKHSRWGVTEHEVRTNTCSPKVAYSLSVKEASVPFNKNKSQSCSLFFLLL